MKTHFETETCSRCHGSGSYSYCADYGDKCFKCAGSGKTLTKRGAAARNYLEKLSTIPASQLAVGDRVAYTGVTLGGKTYSTIGTVTAIESRQLKKVTKREIIDREYQGEKYQSLMISTEYSFEGQSTGSGSSSSRLMPGETAETGITEEIVTETTVSLTSKYGNLNITSVDGQYRVFRQDNEANIAKALEYQNTLTKQGKERKRG